VVNENCIRCKYTDCVEVCPVDCFREGPNMLVIAPDECIDSELWVPGRPPGAIRPEGELPEDPKHMIAPNAELAAHWPPLTHRKNPLPYAEEWIDRSDKLSELQR
jgi:ferredoxin